MLKGFTAEGGPGWENNAWYPDTTLTYMYMRSFATMFRSKLMLAMYRARERDK